MTDQGPPPNAKAATANNNRMVNSDYPKRPHIQHAPPPFHITMFESSTIVRTQYLDTQGTMRVGDVLVKTGRTQATFSNQPQSQQPPQHPQHPHHRQCELELEEEEEEEQSIASSHSSNSFSSKSSADDKDHKEEEEEEEEIAYLLVRKIAKAIYGGIYHGVILKKSNNTTNAMFQLTKEHCAIKKIDRQRLQAGQSQGQAEDAEKEIRAMKFFQSYAHDVLSNGGPSANAYTATIYGPPPQPPQQHANHAAGAAAQPITPQDIMHQTNNMTQLDSIYDDRYIYNIMPFIQGGELFAILEKRSTFNENEARFVMKQIFYGLRWLQKAGMAHRDMSLENLMMDRNGRVFIIDLGMCIRIPYIDANGFVVDQRECSRSGAQNGNGTRAAEINLDDAMNGINLNGGVTGSNPHLERSIISPSCRCGKWYYMSPEIYYSQHFDGHSADVWGTGVILFIMLTGFPPWQRADMKDKFFRAFSGGHLVHTLRQWDVVNLSEEAMDLLQRMFYLKPWDRLSLDQVEAHEWMRCGPMTNPMTGETHL